MKLYIDDTRQAPEGWVLVTTFKDALQFIEENAADITHISFDYYLSEILRSHNGLMLIGSLINIEKYEGIKIFHAPFENYTYHSSDSCMNNLMKERLAEHLGFTSIPKEVIVKSKLEMLRKAKRR